MDLRQKLIAKQMRVWERARSKAIPAGSEDVNPPRIITVSRSSGSRGMYLAGKLAKELGCQLLTREHIDLIANSVENRERIQASLDDKSRAWLQEKMKKLRPSHATGSNYACNLYESILPMGRLGGVLLVGRGANYILGLNWGFHIRVVCDVNKRIANYIRYNKMSREDAAKIIRKSDKERRKFMKRLYDAEIDDPHYYDVVINSEFVDFEELVPCLASAYHSKMDKLKHMHSRGLL